MNANEAYEDFPSSKSEPFFCTEELLATMQASNLFVGGPLSQRTLVQGSP